MNNARKSIIRELMKYNPSHNVKAYIRQSWTDLNNSLDYSRSNNLIEARCLWFDKSSGEGMILMPDGETIYVEFHALDYIRSYQDQSNKYLAFYPEYQLKHVGMIEDGSKVFVSVYENLYSKQIDLCVVPV